MKTVTGIFRSCITLLALMTVLLGGVYPLLVTGIAQVAFPYHANGSLLMRDGKVIGSELLGQQIGNEWYFWGRMSATHPNHYGAASGGSNLGPTNKKLLDNVLGRVRKLQRAYPDNSKPVPVDLVTASASGLDPHISVDAALYQLPRVAKARNMDKNRLQKLIGEHTESFAFGTFGTPYVNVLKLNLALEGLAARKK